MAPKHGVVLPFACPPFEFVSPSDSEEASPRKVTVSEWKNKVYFKKFYTVLKETREKRTSAKKKIHVVQHAREKVSSGKP